MSTSDRTPPRHVVSARASIAGPGFPLPPLRASEPPPQRAPLPLAPLAEIDAWVLRFQELARVARQQATAASIHIIKAEAERDMLRERHTATAKILSGLLRMQVLEPREPQNGSANPLVPDGAPAPTADRSAPVASEQEA